MTHSTTYEGTGDEIGRIPLGDVGTIIVKDDGCNDSDVSVRYEAPDGSDAGGSYSLFNTLRRKLGDDGLESLLDDFDATAVAAADAPTTNPDSTTWTRGPPAFKCDGCNLTWARAKNQNPGPNGLDVCPTCDPDDIDPGPGPRGSP